MFLIQNVECNGARMSKPRKIKEKMRNTKGNQEQTKVARNTRTRPSNLVWRLRLYEIYQNGLVTSRRLTGHFPEASHWLATGRRPGRPWEYPSRSSSTQIWRSREAVRAPGGPPKGPIGNRLFNSRARGKTRLTC